ncbi:MAG: type III pantothenate kinase [Acidimicrobiia bacterium]
MLLVVDVGNTQTVIGLFEGDELVDHWRVATNAERTSDEHALMINDFLGFHGYSFDDDIDGVAMCSGVPRLTAALREMCERYFGFSPLVVGPGVKTGMPVLYDNPKEVGPDRIADAVAAWTMYGGPTIVVDFGTATVFDVISGRGEYLGGAIIPGIEVSLEALYGRASLLRRVELVEPPSVIGRSTVESIQSGAVYGFSGMVETMCRRIMDELGERATVVATGGLGGLMAPLSATIEHYEPWLTLHGLRLIHEKNR